MTKNKFFKLTLTTLATLLLMTTVASTKIVNTTLALTSVGVSEEIDVNKFRGNGVDQYEFNSTINETTTFNPTEITSAVTAQADDGSYISCGVTNTDAYPIKALITKYNQDGSIVFEKVLGNEKGAIACNSIAAAPDGTIYFTGPHQHRGSVTTDLPGLPNNFSDLLVVKLSSTGDLIDYRAIQTGFEVSSTANGYNIKIDSDGNVLVGGTARGSNYDAQTPGTGAQSPLIVTKLSPELDVLNQKISFVNNPQLYNYRNTIQDMYTFSDNTLVGSFSKLSSPALTPEMDTDLIFYDQNLNVVKDMSLGSVLEMPVAAAIMYAVNDEIFVVGRYNDAANNYPMVIAKFDKTGVLLAENKIETPNFPGAAWVANLNNPTVNIFGFFLTYNDFTDSLILSATIDSSTYTVSELNQYTLELTEQPIVSDATSSKTLPIVADTQSSDLLIFSDDGTMNRYTWYYAPTIVTNEDFSVDFGSATPSIEQLTSAITDDETQASSLINEVILDDNKPLNTRVPGVYPVYVKSTDERGYYTIAVVNVTVLENDFELVATLQEDTLKVCPETDVDLNKYAQENLTINSEEQYTVTATVTNSANSINPDTQIGKFLTDDIVKYTVTDASGNVATVELIIEVDASTCPPTEPTEPTQTPTPEVSENQESTQEEEAPILPNTGK